MKHALRWVAGTALLAMGVALAACQAPASSGKPAAESMELKLYEVPAAQTDTLRSALTLAMVSKASVSQAAPGQLLVYAPRSAQASIGAAIEALGKATPEPAPSVQLRVNFWVIDGEPGAGADDPSLKDLAGSLAVLRQTVGPLHFHLDQAASLVGNGDDGNSLTTGNGELTRLFESRATAIHGDTARLQLRYTDGNGSSLHALNTQVDATFGQYLLLAQAPGACAASVPANCPDKPALRLLVVRVDRLPAKA